MDSFDDDPMYNNVNYSDDEEENSDIAIIEDDNEKDINAKKADDPLVMRDETCYSNTAIDTKEAAKLVLNINNWYYFLCFYRCLTNKI